MKKYKIRCFKKGVYYTQTVNGEPIELMEGYEFFVHGESTIWTVSEVSTGYQVAESHSKDGAIQKAKHNLETQRYFFINQVMEKVQQNKILFNELF